MLKRTSQAVQFRPRPRRRPTPAVARSANVNRGNWIYCLLGERFARAGAEGVPTLARLVCECRKCDKAGEGAQCAGKVFDGIVFHKDSLVKLTDMFGPRRPTLSPVCFRSNGRLVALGSHPVEDASEIYLLIDILTIHLLKKCLPTCCPQGADF